MTINRERIQLLVDTLRSDRFRQGRGLLAQKIKGQERHCCLGVACVIAQEQGLPLTVDWTPVDGHSDGLAIAVFTDAFGNADNTGLPEAVYDWYGFGRTPQIQLSGEVAARTGTRVVPAYYANDQMHLTFAQIADGFERMYLSDPTASNNPYSTDPISFTD